MTETSKRSWTLPEWASIAALAILALALRLIYVWQISDTTLVIPNELDPAFYYNWAMEIAAGSWLGTDAFVQSPLYAYLLGLFMMLFGADVTRILVIQAVIGCGTVLLTYYAGRMLFGHRQGILAGLLIALYGPFIFYEGMVMKTLLSPLMTLLLLLVLDRARDRAVDPDPGTARTAARAFILAGALFGLLTLDRDNFIVLAPAMAGLALYLGGGFNRRGWLTAAAFTLGTVLVIAPVTVRNWAVSKEFVLLTTGGGEVFFIGNNADANGLYVPPAFVRPEPQHEHADFIQRASEITGRSLSPMESSWFWFRQGMQFIVEEPLAWGRLLWRKLLHFWNSYELPDNLDYVVMQWFSPLLEYLNPNFPPQNAPTLVIPWGGQWVQTRLHLISTFGTVAPLGLLGIYLTRRRWRRLLPAYVLLFGYMGTVLLFFNFARFRVPVVPLLALFASEGLLALGRHLRKEWDLAVAFAGRSGDMVERARALRPDRSQIVAAVILVAALVGINLELPRGAVPAIEQALMIGNAYYAQGDAERARQSYFTGLVLLGEGPEGELGDELLRRHFGRGITRDVLLAELEIEAVARGPQFKGIHLGIHHGMGIALVLQAERLLDEGRRKEAMPLLDQAIAQFNESLRLAPAYILSHRKMARAYQLKGDTPTAVEWLNKGVDLWPDDLQTRLDLAEMLYSSREYNAALRNLEEVYRYKRDISTRDLAQIHVSRALIFYSGLIDRGKALFNYERAIELNPDHALAPLIRRRILELRAGGALPVPDEIFEATEESAGAGSGG